MNTLATVVTLTGRAWAVTADGQRRKLKEGDSLRGDEMLVTEPGARVDLDFDNNQMLTFLGEQQQNIGEAIEFAQAELPPSAPRPAAEGRQQPQAQPAQADGEPEGHNFVQLVRINEIIEADGITPLTIARIQEVLRPLGMSLPERVYDLDEWREHRGGDERYEDAPAARHPGLTVELQGAGPDGIYSEAEIGTDGTVPAEVTLDDKVRVGDRLVIKDGKGNILLDRPVTQNDLDNGVTVEVPVVPGDRNVTVEATVTTPRGYTGQDRDDKPVDNLPSDEVTILPPQDSEDAESINLDLGSYFEDNVDGKDLTYDVTGLPPGLSFDPDTGIITGTIDRSASQGGPDDDGIYKVTVTITDKVGNQTTIDFDWTVTNPEPEARDDRQTIDEDTVATGNVLTGAGNDPGVDGSDSDPDGDDLTVTSFTIGNDPTVYPADGTPVSVEDADGNLIGEITLNENGDYSFTPVPDWNGSVPDIHYTISDGEGGEDEARLSITVAPVNDPVELENIPDPNDPNDPGYPAVNDPTDPNDPARGNVNDHVVFESGLAGGSATNADDTRVVSSFTLSALDGLDDTAAITIEVAGNSLTLSKAEVEDLLNNNQSITTEYGELLLNGYTPNADGSISIDYQYTLTSAPDNTGGNGVHTDDIISITVNDRDTDSDSQDLVIRIIDDAPVARDDANAIDEDETSVSGNVIVGSMTGDVADTEGADGATVTAIVSDNDATSTATTNIDGDLVIVGEFGTLTISPDGSYTYALNNDNAEVNALKTGETLVDEFSYTLTDIDGDSDTATLTITINGNTDGAPTIVPEDVNGPDVPTDITSQGHVTVHERGLTGADSTHINDGSVTITAPDGLQSITVGGVPVDLAQLAALDPNDPATHIEIDTPQGKLTLTGFDVTDSVGGVPTEGELQFTYELEEVQNTPADPADPDVGRNSTETIPLIVTDAGGETGTGDLVINIIDDVPVAEDDVNAITEDELSVTGNVIGGPSAAAGDEADTQGADGATVTEVRNAATGSNMTTLPNGDLVIEGQYGTLTIRPDGFYTYELNNEHPEVNALKDGDDLQDVFTYTLTDGDGDSDTADLTITINGRTDGAPSIVPEDVNGNGAIDGHNTVNESGLVGGSTAGDGSNIVDGTIQISAGDGLASITITGQTFDMADLQALSASTPSAAIPVEGGTLVLTGFTPGTSVGGVPTSGILEYTYTLTSERAHSGSEDQSLLLDIPLSVTDAGNGTANGTLTIQVVDDAPQASDDTNSITEDDLSVVGNVIDGDAAGDGADIEGADSATITDISSTSGNSADDSDPSGVLVIEGEYGTLTIQPNGEYEYVLNNDNAEVNKLKDGETLTEEFTYTLTDTDGDSDTARLTITINGRTDASPR